LDDVALPDYEQDLVAWAEANACLLRAGRLSEVDAEHIAEELEDVGKSERRALGSHLRNLMLHLLKWQFQPGLRGPSWRRSLQNSRQEIQVVLTASPSLRSRVQDLVADEYPRALRLAVTETGLPERAFPTDCPYAIEQLLDEDWLPDPAGG
jgi:hypothetical protein